MSNPSREQRAPEAPPLEVEWQFDVVDLAPVEVWLRRGIGVPGLKAREGDTRALEDAYYDTADWRFYRAGWSVRIRTKGGDGAATEATLKSLEAATDGGPRRRTEFNEPIDAPTIEALRAAPGPVGARVRALAGSAALLERGRARTERSNYAITATRSNGVLATLSLDRSEFGTEDDARGALARVEIELEPGAALERMLPLIEGFERAFPAEPAESSKFMLALRYAGALPPVIEPGPPPPGKDATLGELAQAAVHAQLHALRTHEAGTRLGEDIEELHDIRVATRRLRAALAAFKGAFDEDVAPLRDELRWIAAVMGEVRDLDVQIEELDRWTNGRQPPAGTPLEVTLGPLRNHLEGERAVARERLIAAFDSERYAALLTSIEARVEPGALAPAALEVGRAATQPLLLRAHRRFRSAAHEATLDAPPPMWHAARIAGKRLRYALEFVEPLWGRRARTPLNRLKLVQDLLGEFQDAEVADARLRAIAEAGTLPHATLFAMGEWAGVRSATAAARRSEAPRLLDALEEDWRPLRAALDRASHERTKRGRSRRKRSTEGGRAALG